MMKHFPIPILSVLAFTVAACGGGEPADSAAADTPAAPAVVATSAAPTGPMTIPDWFHVDAEARTVHMTITAGGTPAWNYNDAPKGGMAITVPEGYTVTVDLVNEDPVMAHSLGISTETSNFSGVLEAVAAFEGGITEDARSMLEGTMPGETESITFVAETAGEYSMVCYIAGHSLVGMWLYFNVSDDGSVGVQGA